MIAIDDPLEEPAAPPDPIEWNLIMVGAPTVWSEYGVTGQGIVVSEIDTGVQWDHPALINQYRGWDGTTADHNYNWYDPYKQSPDIPSDSAGHGTHVMGTMVGSEVTENQVGMAPGARWIACKGGDNVSGYLLTDELLQCAEWILAPTDLQGNNPNPSLRPHLVNNSWGGGQEDYWFTSVVDAWSAAGIFTMFSIGNAGPECSTASSPGDGWNVFASGASDSSDQIASFSSRGPTLIAGYLKPNITAPGSGIRSSLPGDRYGTYSGTSMASPHVAGAIALLWSSNPELIGQINLSRWVLQQSAVPKTTNEACGGDLPTAVPNNTWGWGRLDIYAAVTLARAGGVTPEWLLVAPQAGEVAPGGSQLVTLNFHPSLDMAGTYTATLWIVADDPLNSDVRIPVTLTVGEVSNLFSFFPLIFKTAGE
jgi:subtilisin family serine protease